MYGRNYDPAMGPYFPRVPPTPRTPANQQSASAIGVSTTCGAVSTRWTTRFHPHVMELQMYGRISDSGMGPCPHWLALAPRTLANQQSASGVGVPHRARRYRHGGLSFSSPVCYGCRCLEGFVIRGCDTVLPGWRWLHEPQPICNQPVGLGFPHHSGR